MKYLRRESLVLRSLGPRFTRVLIEVILLGATMPWVLVAACGREASVPSEDSILSFLSGKGTADKVRFIYFQIDPGAGSSWDPVLALYDDGRVFLSQPRVNNAIGDSYKGTWSKQGNTVQLTFKVHEVEDLAARGRMPSTVNAMQNDEVVKMNSSGDIFHVIGSSGLFGLHVRWRVRQSGAVSRDAAEAAFRRP